MKRALLLCLLVVSTRLMAQIEVDVFQRTANATTAQVGIRARATGAPVNFIGVTFYLLYQSANAAPQSTGTNTVVGVDDSRLTTIFGWGTGSRFTNPQLSVGPIDPGVPGGEVYNRRYIYGNSDDAGGANVRTLTAVWDTLIYITFNTLQPSYPQGGYAYMQSTSEAGGAAFTDEGFANVSFIVNSGDRPLGPVSLPVTFSNYNVQCTNNGVSVIWRTAGESNSSHFVIQKSLDGSNWSDIGSVLAAGNSSTEKAYQFFDIAGGAAQYRVKQVDKDGRAVYTEIKRTTCEGKPVNVLLFPVPAKDRVNVAIRSDKTIKTELLITDAAGRIVMKQSVTITAGSNNFGFDVSRLAAGEYLLSSSDPTMPVSKRFVVAR